ncbi:hypothetical protein CYMTET_53799 [Cymbomonas tetramitiformis]|uniref:Uncharacterized protein n=1 Tax=Cymbomonas tetramitiformis TaxID=36881 RepID=A0AAE0EPP6_9CHLO|nr:hypothetical protein CYMTET_53799 [Cymbomonas tetramitiformis]
MDVMFEVPLPAGTRTDEIAISILFGDVDMVNKKLAGNMPLSDLDLVFDPSGTAFSVVISDKCSGDEYDAKARSDDYVYSDDRNEPKVCTAVANDCVCTPARKIKHDVVWRSFVRRDAALSPDCNLGISIWKLTFDISEWTVFNAMQANGIVKQKINVSEIYTFPLRIFITSTSKSTSHAETLDSPFQFELYRKSMINMNLRSTETQLSGYRLYRIEKFKQTTGNIQIDRSSAYSHNHLTWLQRLHLFKVDFDMEFFKEANHDAHPKLSVDLNDLIIKMNNSDGSNPFDFFDEYDSILVNGKSSCLSLNDKLKSTIQSTHGPTIIQQDDLPVGGYVKSVNGTFFKEVLHVTCYLNVHDNQLSFKTERNIPMIIEYTHTYSDHTTSTLMTNPLQAPVAIFDHDMLYTHSETLEYETPLKGAIYTIPQKKISSLDRNTWESSDIENAMIDAFSSTADEPTRVRSVSVDTPITVAVTLVDQHHKDNFNLKPVVAFLMGNRQGAINYVGFADQDEESIVPNPIIDPCFISSHHANGDIIGLSTLHMDETSTIVEKRLSDEVKDYLKNTNSQSFYVDADIFQINDKLGTQPILSNLGLTDPDGPKNLLMIPFLPKLKIAGEESTDSHTIRMCMIVEAIPVQQSSASARKLMQVHKEVRKEVDG